MNMLTPLGRSSSPGHLKSRGDSVRALAGLVRVLPAKTLLLDRCSIRLIANVVGRSGTVGLAEGVAAGNKCNSLLVVHGHAAESGADVMSSSDGVWHTVGTLGVDVDQTHVSGRERVLEVLLVCTLALNLALVTIDNAALCQAG